MQLIFQMHFVPFLKMMKWYMILFIFQYCLMYVSAKIREPIKYNQTDPSAKFDNPNFVKDRNKNEINRPDMPTDWKNRFKQPFTPAWMDYCDPYHCNDYHKVACGLNRKQLRFKWFQSVCHIILNNKCAGYRGTLRYDVVDAKFCYIYVMYLRQGCSRSCEPEGDPVCGVSLVDNHLTVFPDRCTMEQANCEGGKIDEYEEVDFGLCSSLL